MKVPKPHRRSLAQSNSFQSSFDGLSLSWRSFDDQCRAQLDERLCGPRVAQLDLAYPAVQRKDRNIFLTTHLDNPPLRVTFHICPLGDVEMTNVSISHK